MVFFSADYSHKQLSRFQEAKYKELFQVNALINQRLKSSLKALKDFSTIIFHLKALINLASLISQHDYFHYDAMMLQMPFNVAAKTITTPIYHERRTEGISENEKLKIKFLFPFLM